MDDKICKELSMKPISDLGIEGDIVNFLNDRRIKHGRWTADKKLEVARKC